MRISTPSSAALMFKGKFYSAYKIPDYRDPNKLSIVVSSNKTGRGKMFMGESAGSVQAYLDSSMDDTERNDMLSRLMKL